MHYQITYRSQAIHPKGHISDLDILRAAIKVNTRFGVTGFLARHNQHFLQILEGDEIAVRGILEKIKRDPRHYDFKVLQEGFAAERNFPDWSMGYADLSELKSLEHTAQGAMAALLSAAETASPSVLVPH